MTKYLRISSYIRKPFLIYDFCNRSHMNFLIYEGNFILFFISVQIHGERARYDIFKNGREKKQRQPIFLLIPIGEQFCYPLS
jgi:hypothetical protein